MKAVRAGTLVLAALAAVAWPHVRASDVERVAPRLREALDRSAEPQLVWVFLRDKGPAEAGRWPRPGAGSRRGRRPAAPRGRAVGIEDAAASRLPRRGGPPRAARAARAALVQRGHRGGHGGAGAGARRAALRPAAGRGAPLPAGARGDRGFVAGGLVAGRAEPRALTLRHRLRHVPRPAPADRRARGARVGLHGEGVVVAVFDTGFNNLAHEAFAAHDHRGPPRLRERRRGRGRRRRPGRGQPRHRHALRAGRASARASSSAPPSPPASSWPRPRTRTARRRSRRTTGRRPRSGRRRWARTSSAARWATSTTTARSPATASPT